MEKFELFFFPLLLLVISAMGEGEVVRSSLERLQIGEIGEEGKWWETTTVYQIYPRSFQVFRLQNFNGNSTLYPCSTKTREVLYLPSFGGVRTFSSSSIHLQGWIRKSIPVVVDWEGLTVLKSILPYRGSELIFGATAATDGRVKFLKNCVNLSEKMPIALLFPLQKCNSSCSKHNNKNKCLISV